jgi:hypothetical protein
MEQRNMKENSNEIKAELKDIKTDLEELKSMILVMGQKMTDDRKDDCCITTWISTKHEDNKYTVNIMLFIFVFLENAKASLNWRQKCFNKLSFGGRLGYIYFIDGKEFIYW